MTVPLTPLTDVLSVVLQDHFKCSEEEADQVAFGIAHDILQAEHVVGDVWSVRPIKNVRWYLGLGGPSSS
jgi:hypothetical protein